MIYECESCKQKIISGLIFVYQDLGGKRYSCEKCNCICPDLPKFDGQDLATTGTTSSPPMWEWRCPTCDKEWKLYAKYKWEKIGAA